MDEAGYTLDWESDIDQQPFYVASAVCIPADQLPGLYQWARRELAALESPDEDQPIGLGHEIKARDIARGTGWWRDHNVERNIVRDLFLLAPIKASGTAFVAVIDKAKHQAKYVTPANPYFLAMTFVLERVDLFLSQNSDYAYCIYDQNKRIEPEIYQHSAYLIREGSLLMYFSSFSDSLVVKKNRLSHILELSSGVSENSIGLQVADYFATMTYQYFTRGKPDECGWWDTLVSSLNVHDGTLHGIGLKIFP